MVKSKKGSNLPALSPLLQYFTALLIIQQCKAVRLLPTPWNLSALLIA